MTVLDTNSQFLSFNTIIWQLTFSLWIGSNDCHKIGFWWLQQSDSIMIRWILQLEPISSTELNFVKIERIKFATLHQTLYLDSNISMTVKKRSNKTDWMFVVHHMSYVLVFVVDDNVVHNIYLVQYGYWLSGHKVRLYAIDVNIQNR